MLSQRIQKLYGKHQERVSLLKPSHFFKDYHQSGLNQFANLPQWEKTARAMAYAITNQNIIVYDDDGLGGRVNHNSEEEVEENCPDLDYYTKAKNSFKRLYPYREEMLENQLIFDFTAGHITWRYDLILSLGVEGLKQQYQKALKKSRSVKQKQFYQGVLILLDSMLEFNDKHIEAYQKIGNIELAERMKRVPRYACETFEDAVQAFFMQHIVVMRENPYGGNGPGRLDYYLWPYLERDLVLGRCNLERAKELIDELFLRINERIYDIDTWTEAIVVGGTDVDGSSAVNPLTYLMIESIMELKIIHPSVYVRIPENPPKGLLEVCAKYLTSGCNRAQILNDKAIINALTLNGVEYADAIDYVCGGCMEIGMQGKNSDLLYVGWQNVPKMLELMISGGISLTTGKRVKSFNSKGLDYYEDFESFYQDFISEANRFVKILLHEQDLFSQQLEKNRPSYLMSSMIEGCLQKGKNMQGGGAKYHDYGATPLGLPNVVDGLYAIKKAVFEDKICTSRELMDALKCDFKGYERLQAKLRAIPKFGMDDVEADQMASRVLSDFADMYHGYTTRHNGRGRPTVLTFIYSPDAARILGATPDGRKAHSGVAYGVTPQSSSMTKGITAAINSCAKLPFEKLSGGASTMWDFDSSWVNEEIVIALVKTFLDKGGQIFQGNTTSVQDLIEAKKNPQNYPNLIVRVGGYSARFIHLYSELQDDIINRIRHLG